MKAATLAKWRSRVTEWRGSGLTADAFAAGKGFEGSTLRFWSSQLARKEDEAREPVATPVAMARVVRAPTPSRDAGLTIAIGQARVVVARGFDAELLREVVGALEETS